jgi:F-box/WD-40 domain protein MET30
VRELIRIDFLAALPAEVSFRILCFLDTTSLCKAAQVSRRWRQLADDDVVWHRMCEQHIDRKCTTCGWGLPLLERKRLRASKRQIQLRATGRGIDERSPEITPNPEAFKDLLPPAGASLDQTSSNYESVASGRPSPIAGTKGPGVTKQENDYLKKTRPWKDVYKDRFKIGSNWKYGRCSTKIFAGHTNGVMCLQFYDNILATGSYDATIKMWNIETGKEIRTLRDHAMGIRCLQFDDTKLISGSLDKTLKIWNWRTGECLSTYNGHADGVISLHFDSNILVSGSIDKTAKIWNFEDRSIFTLRGHTDWVNSVKIDSPSRTIFTASDDITVRLWDLDTKMCIRIFEGHTGQVQQVLPLPHGFELADEELTLSTEDDGSPNSSQDQYFPYQNSRETPSSIDIRYRETFGDTDRPSPPPYILTSGLDSTIRLWEVETGRCIRTFFGHVEGVWAIGADTLRIVSGAEDRMVKVWDPRTGKCDRTFTGHAGPVTCIGLSDSRMCSGSEDGEVRMHSFK